jgi:hypothetical protein
MLHISKKKRKKEKKTTYGIKKREHKPPQGEERHPYMQL